MGLSSASCGDACTGLWDRSWGCPEVRAFCVGDVLGSSMADGVSSISLLSFVESL
jgi:hypothetical protein